MQRLTDLATDAGLKPAMNAPYGEVENLDHQAATDRAKLKGVEALFLLLTSTIYELNAGKYPRAIAVQRSLETFCDQKTISGESYNDGNAAYQWLKNKYGVVKPGAKLTLYNQFLDTRLQNRHYDSFLGEMRSQITVLDLAGPESRIQCFAALEKAIAHDPHLGHMRLEVMDKLSATKNKPDDYTILDALDRLEGFVQPLLTRRANCRTDKTHLQDFQSKGKGRGRGKGKGPGRGSGRGGGSATPSSDKSDSKNYQRCAGTYTAAHTADTCPALNKTCNFCGRKGHLEAACFQKNHPSQVKAEAEGVVAHPPLTNPITKIPTKRRLPTW